MGIKVQPLMIITLEWCWREGYWYKLPDFDSILGFGGGLAIDVGKYIAWNLNKVKEPKWYVKPLPKNSKFGDNTLVDKDLGDLMKSDEFRKYRKYMIYLFQKV